MSEINFTLATCIRNEGPYIIEWYLYYKNLGVDNFIVYSNDNTDSSDNLLSLMHEYSMIDWRPRTLSNGESPQLTAYKHLSEELFSRPDLEGDYLAWFDMDEFLVLKNHDTIQDMIKSFEFPDALVVSWKHFGSSGLINYQDSPTIDKFLLCSSDNPQNKLFKTISRIDSSLYKSINNHHPIVHKNVSPNVIYATKDRVKLPDSFLHGDNPVKYPEANCYYDVCQLNHYAIRSKQEFEWKRHRGNGRLSLDADRKHFLNSYFSKHDSNEEVDTLAKDKYSTNLNIMFAQLPLALKLAHNEIVSGLMFNYGNCEEEKSEPPITINFTKNENSKYISNFSLDNNVLNFIPGKEITIGGVFVLDTEDLSVLNIKIINNGRSKSALINQPSPGMKNRYQSKFNSSNSRFSFKFCSYNDLLNSSVVVELSNNEILDCGRFSLSSEAFSPVVSRSHSLEFMKLASFIKDRSGGLPVIYIANKGNLGDALIRQGAIAFFDKYNINFIELEKDFILSSDFRLEDYDKNVCIYGGGGQWCKATPGAKSIVDKLSKIFSRVIVLPSTYELTGVWSNVDLWARGNNQSYYNSSGYFCHDMAFALGKIDCVRGHGDAFFYRTDKEASGKHLLPNNNRDLSLEGNAYSDIYNFFDAISQYENIYTDRLHVAIAACLMNKRVFLSSSSYFKIPEIYNSSLKDFFPKAHFVEV